MAIVHWAPLQEIEMLQREMDQLFDAFSPRINARVSTHSYASPEGESFVPPIEMYETSDAVHVNVELPGLDAKDLDIQVMAEAVLVKGDRKMVRSAEQDHPLRSEFRYGSFQRVIPLPARIQNNNVEAAYNDGILRLRLPKVDSEKNKVVKINLG